MKKSKTTTFRILSILGKIIFWIFSAIVILILSLALYPIIGAIQKEIFLPKDYIMWLFKYPFSRLLLIYEVYIILGFLYIFNKSIREAILWVISLKEGFLKRHKRFFVLSFAVFNIVLIYSMLYNTTVITDNKIINYTFLCPQGKEYGYKDIVKIDAGVYGKKTNTNSYPHYSRGDFYYIVQLNDGTKLHLTDFGGTKNEEDVRFIIEKLDSEYVSMDISKVSSMDNFEYCTKNLGKIYTDKIRNILLNIKNDNCIRRPIHGLYKTYY